MGNWQRKLRTMHMVDNPPYKNPTFLVDDRMKLILFVPVLARVYSYMYEYIFIYTFIYSRYIYIDSYIADI